MAHVNPEQVKRLRRFLQGRTPDVTPLNFYSVGEGSQEIVLRDMYPPIDHPAGVQFFFAAIVLNYGFWFGDASGYRRPMMGRLAGKEVKGSDLLWRMLRAELARDPKAFEPERLANLSESQFERMMADDDGSVVWPDGFMRRLDMLRAYGIWSWSHSPRVILSTANHSDYPLGVFLGQLRRAPGYGGDQLQKKATLLAMALMLRPERFLRPAPDEELPPVVDYHLMRVALRMGLVVLTRAEESALRKRSWIEPELEHSIRAAVYHAMEGLAGCGWSGAELDALFWSARRYCPEMTEPDCGSCMLRDPCLQRTELFQPVVRTTLY